MSNMIIIIIIFKKLIKIKSVLVSNRVLFLEKLLLFFPVELLRNT